MCVGPLAPLWGQAEGQCGEILLRSRGCVCALGPLHPEFCHVLARGVSTVSGVIPTDCTELSLVSLFF